MSSYKVLVTTIGAWSSKTGGDTMSTLMSQYGAENVAALYIRANPSDSKSASTYFQIIEGRVLKSIFKKDINTGVISSPVELKVEKESGDVSAEQKRYRIFRKHRFGIFLFARELVWSLGRWKSPELENFLDDFRPDVLIFPIEGYIHFNHINEYIISKYAPKVIGFLWDDNFTYKQQPFNITHQIYRFFLRRSVLRLVKKCHTIFALSPKMKDECDSEFRVNCQLLTKPIFNISEFQPYKLANPIRILYTGNLLIGRLETLKVISSSLNVVNKDRIKVVLDVYTNTHLSEKEVKAIECDSCMLHGPISQKEVFEKQKSADVLLFLESLSRHKNQSARLSFSTKITDYFGAGKCIWSVSSTTLSAADYLKREDVALVSETKEEIIDVLTLMINTPECINKYAQKAHECGCQKHNADLIIGRLYDAINQ
ncbi:hypothetical protein [uncultured Bacteroides sp.]|uniref:hypothetical protein n=1 Tax=uncultured Bacteroides sp. TaxID=162156 RepID=UPI0025D09685|nr:hypothetical protein [uncultured Bacteroides sp.]